MKPKRTWIERIERLRLHLNNSSEVLEVTDYGADRGDSDLTPEEMYSGRLVRRTIGEICKLTSRTDRSGLLLLRLVRELKPGTCIELGTSVGISGCYQATALKLNGTGKLVTLEGAPAVASVASRNFTGLGFDNVEVVRGRFQDTLSQVLAANAPVDYAFIDGHHDERATLAYFDTFVPALTTNATVVFDDIDWSDGMRRAWHAIRKHNGIRISIDLGSMGLIFIGDTSCPQHIDTRF